MSGHLGVFGVSNITNRTDPMSLRSRVFVGNLNTVHMTKVELESIFSKYGAVIGISVHKGYAFVQYANEGSARAAVAGEDSKLYYNMALDVTIASEPKNRKRGRSNASTTPNNPTNLLNGPAAIPDLTLQAQHALSTLANSQVLSSLQQLGLEGLIGQPNLNHFAAAASSLLSSHSAGQYPAGPGLNILGGGGHHGQSSGMRPKQTRISGSQQSLLSSTSSSTTHQLSSSAKRTRLDGMMNTHGHSTSLPTGARCQNLVSLVSPDTSHSRAAAHAKQLPSPAKKPPSGYCSPSDGHLAVGPSRSTTGDTLKRQAEPISKCASPRPLDKVVPGNVKSNESTNGSFSGASLYPLSPAHFASDDILICGSCRRLFDHVDELISHKMAGCSLSHVPCESCRCRFGEPENLDCAYCGANFNSAWLLMNHCHSDHGLTIYALPSPTNSPRRSPTSSTSTSAETKKPSVAEDDEDGGMEKEKDIGADGQTNSDWEADADTYADVTEEARPSNDSEHRNASPAPSPDKEAKTEPATPKERSASPEEQPHRRLRGDDSGPNEADANEDDDADEDDGVNVRVSNNI